jgi:uncharacterized membrane protein (DUF4010 family)
MTLLARRKHGPGGIGLTSICVDFRSTTATCARCLARVERDGIAPRQAAVEMVSEQMDRAMRFRR